MTEQVGRPFRGTIEDLLRRIERLPKTGEPEGGQGFELWIPGRLTLRGQTIPSDVAMMVLLDALLEKDFVPAGFTEEDGGKLYRYERSRDD